MASGKILEYSGRIDFRTIDQLLIRLRKSKDFILLGKSTGKRVYSVIVECLENIVRHSGSNNQKDHPFISAEILNRVILVRTGNVVSATVKKKLEKELNLVNVHDENDVYDLYVSRINADIPDGGAGLGLIMMRLKSGNLIEYSFRPAGADSLYFEMEISVKKQYMRKLIVKETTSSPKVILDPEKEVFEISGESRPPDVAAFYSGILSWFDEYSRVMINSKSETEAIAFNLDLEYFNSSSAKYILDLCKKIAGVSSGEKQINVRWHYEQDDTDMLEAGQEMSRMSKIPFEYVMKPAK
jgi:hypothetical protein